MQFTEHHQQAAGDTPAPASHVFGLGFEAGQHDVRERARLAALALASAHLDEDSEAQTRLDWDAFPIGLYLHKAIDAVSVGLATEGTDHADLLHPDEADELADALRAYANAARSVAR